MDRLTAMMMYTRVVERGSFSAVARELDTTQPTVSKQIAALEKHLGTTLLNRTTRGLSVTDAGAEYYERCRRILEEVTEAEASVNTLRGVSGTLRATIPVGFGTRLILPLIPKFMAAYPNLEIDLSLSDRHVNLVEDGIDIAIRLGALTDSTMIVRPLGTGQRVTVAAPAYLARHGTPVEPADLAHHSCIVFSLFSTVNRWRFQGPKEEISVSVRGRLRTDHADAIRTGVLAGIGIAFAPVWLVADDIAQGRLVTLLDEFPPATYEIHALYAPTRYVPSKVRAFTNFLLEAFKAHPLLN